MNNPDFLKAMPPAVAKIAPHPSYLPALRSALWTVLGLAALQLLAGFWLSWHDQPSIIGYLPLHTLLETVAIVIASCVFAVAWSAFDPRRADSFTLLACVFLGVGVLDFLHMTSYQGMPVFITASSPEKAINFWLAARLLAALGLLAVASGLDVPVRKTTGRWPRLTGVLLLVGFMAWLGLLHHDWLPRIFIAGAGLMPFKLYCEYVLIVLYALAAVMFLRQMRAVQTYDVVGLFAATCIMALAEVFFTWYADVADSYNLLGHIYKVIAYGFIYKSIFIGAIKEPYQRLYEAKNLLEVIINSMPIRIFWKDLSLRYLGCNSLFARDAGMTCAADIIGKHDTQLTWKEQAALYQSDDLQVMASDQPKLNFEEPQTTPDGRQIWLRTSKVPLYDIQKRKTGVLGIYDDITQRNQEELELANYRAHLEELVAQRAEALRESEVGNSRPRKRQRLCSGGGWLV